MIRLNTSKILVPFDFSLTAKKALNHAALLVKYNKGELQLLYVDKPKAIINVGYSFAELREMAEERENFKMKMEETADDIRKKYNISVKVLVDNGRRISGIIKTCEKNSIGMIVMGTEGFDSASNLISGSNSHQVVSKSKIPVITVRSESQTSGFANILVPVDLSEHTRQKMIIAIQLAKIFSSKIHLLGLLVEDDKIDENKLHLILKQIQKRLKAEELDYSCELVKTKNPGRRTLATARHIKADIIITMTDQNSGSPLLVARTYDHELIDDSEIPVLSIPPEIHEENIEPASIGGLW